MLFVRLAGCGTGNAETAFASGTHTGEGQTRGREHPGKGGRRFYPYSLVRLAGSGTGNAEAAFASGTHTGQGQTRGREHPGKGEAGGFVRALL